MSNNSHYTKLQLGNMHVHQQDCLTFMTPATTLTVSCCLDPRLDRTLSLQIGKLLVFESGAVKLQMGEVLLDVTAGTPCQFRQEVAAVNAKDAHFIFLGDVAQRIVCSPNIGQLIK